MGVRIRVGILRGPRIDRHRKSCVQRAANPSTGRERDKDRRHRCARSLSLVEQRQEIDSVLGDYRAILVNGSRQQVDVRRTAEPDISDMDRIVPALDEELSNAFGIHLVDQEPHPVSTAERATVSFRTRSAASSFSRSLASISSKCSAA